MKPSKFRFHPVAAVLAGALSAGFPVSPVLAYDLVWDGSGDSDSWFYSNNNLFDPNSNWTNNDVVPTAGDSLVFAGNTRLTPFNDELPGFVVGGISFAPGAGAFQLNGNAITSTGNITNLSAKLQTVNLPINVGADQTWDGGAAGMAFNGLVTLGNNSLSLLNKTAVNNSNANFVVGDSGIANLSLGSGSSLRSYGVNIGKQSTGQGSVTVNGANSQWNYYDIITIGGNGSGVLNIENGANVFNSNTYHGGSYNIAVLGGGLSGSGKVMVTGTNSLWSNIDVLYVGDYGNGILNIENGGKVSDLNSAIGNNAGGSGVATVTGANSTWANLGDLRIGRGGNGVLNIENGAKVSDANATLGTYSDGVGATTITGQNSLWVNAGKLTVGLHGAGTLLIKNLGMVSVGGDAFIDQGSGSGTVTVQSGGIFDVAGSLNIGDQGKVILNGGELAYGARTIASGGEFNWLSGTVALNKDYLIGADDWLAGLTLNQGKGLKFKQAMTIGDYAGLTLNGGQLAAESLAVATTGNLDWQRGRLTLGSLRLGDPASGFGDYLQLNANKALAITGSLTVGSAATLEVGNGATPTVAKNLQIDGVLAVGSGRVAVGQQISVATGGTISLNNAATSRLAAVDGIANGGTIEGSGRLEGNLQNLNGGKLLLQNSQLTVTGTVDNAAGARIEGQGTLNTGGLNNLGLMAFSGDRTDIRGAVTLTGADSRIVNSGGSVLSFYDTVIHNGQEIRTGTGAQTVFFANVSGAGGFAGDGLVSFEGGYNPGNSPAAINFHGGDISFNATSVLTMEIFGNTPGSEYDQLLNIDHFDFNGTLALVFGGNFTPTAGSSFNLFGFNSFSGSFAPNHITVTGIDRALLDFSALASNGKLQVAAVPLPAGSWLFLSGLMGILAKSRRNVLNRAPQSRPTNAVEKAA